MAFRIGKILVSFVPETFEPGDGGTPPPGEPGGPPTGPNSLSPGHSPAETFEVRLLLHTALARLGGPLTEQEMRPRNLNDLNNLEASLEEALQELRKTKAILG